MRKLVLEARWELADADSAWLSWTDVGTWAAVDPAFEETARVTEPEDLGGEGEDPAPDRCFDVEKP